VPYTAERPLPTPTAEELRARIPGWGADLDPADRPSYPKELSGADTGAHWDLPDRQPGGEGRERSIEHGMLPPVFGTAQPLHGLSGVIRRVAYARFSEGRAAHWLLLVLGDRVDATGAHLRSLLSLHPDNPITETGVLGELSRHPIRSRFGRGRVDLRHQWIDPILVAGPFVLAIVLVIRVLRGRRPLTKG
jgi:hypothetical protein